jgi:DUF971 family protein
MNAQVLPAPIKEGAMTTQRYLRACDASAATRIPGTTCFVTASDEDYLLRIYDETRPGPPLSELDVSEFLEPVNKKKEADVEGAARIDDRIYWIGSHGRDKDGVEQESRHRFFATAMTAVAGRSDLRPTGKPYKQLLTDLANAPDLAEFGLVAAAAVAPEAPGGLNIEGLASTSEGHLLIGFRNPIPQGRALLVRLQNPAAVVDGTGPARVSKGALLDLGGRGVRAIEATTDGRYFILAGSFDDTKDFALFLWDGVSGTPTLALDGSVLNALNPEELTMSVDADGALAVQLFSDDGDALVGEKKCKKADADARSFRVSAVRLTGVV